MTDDLAALAKPFERAAEDAHRAEAGYAKQFEAELATRKRAREFAFRRLGLMRELLKSAGGDDHGAAIAAQVSCLKTELGWHDLAPLKEKTLDEFRKLAAVIHACTGLSEGKKKPPDIAKAFAAFEAWYEAETGAPFLALLDHELPEMPLVDF